MQTSDVGSLARAVSIQSWMASWALANAGLGCVAMRATAAQLSFVASRTASVSDRDGSVVGTTGFLRALAIRPGR